ncbi:MAG TPA: hypothetical protein VFF59_09830, partial [Anaerolineae bacterium]|nr:hypothetical protein [Anaerolineae bacterium]
PLMLATDNGDIRITAEETVVHASTGTGEIFFSGKLAQGNNYFTTTADSSITVMLPREVSYEVIARTNGQAITVQYPYTRGSPVTVCGTMDPGWPVDAHINTNGQKPRAQITISPGTNPVTTTTVFSGVVTANYVMFHTTVRMVRALLPDISDMYLDLLPTAVNIPGIGVVTDNPASAPAAPPPTNLQSPDTVTDPAIQTALDSYKNSSGQVPSAVPLGTTAPAAPPNNLPVYTGAIATDRAVPMRGDNCPLPAQLPQAFPVRVYINSNSGLIRILQMSPGN